MKNCVDANVHARLKERTREIHEELHRHPVLSALARPDLSREIYYSVLVAYSHFFGKAESMRRSLEVWSDFSLQPCLDALDSDLQIASLETDQIAEPSFAWVSCPLSCLGCLYALHGSRHGAIHMSKRIALSLPDAPRNFFALGPDQVNWQSLLRAIEESVNQSENFEMLAKGAETTFCELGSWVTRCVSA